MKLRLVAAILMVVTLGYAAPRMASARTVYERTVTLDVRLVEGELIATGRVYTPKPAGYNCIQEVPIFVRIHQSGATEWSSIGDPDATTDEYGRFRIELPLDSSWAQYRAVVGRQKYPEARKACARAVSPISSWPRNPIALQEPVAGSVLGPETVFKVAVGNPAGVEGVAFKVYAAGTEACPRKTPDYTDYESPYEWTWRPQQASHDAVLGVAAWGRDGFAVCKQWPFHVGELGSLMWWGIAEREEKSTLGESSTWFSTIEGRIPVTGNFDRDAMADIFWYSPNGEEEIWWGDGGSFEEVASQSQLGPGLVPAVGDFDNDGRDDIIWYGYGSATDTIWWGAAGRRWEVSNQPQITGNWDQLVTGDHNGDGFDDIFFYVNTAKTTPCGNTREHVYWWGKSSRSALHTGATTQPGSECYYKWLSGDFDGDTWSDFLAYGQSPNSRDSFTWRNPTASLRVSVAYGFHPFVGDFNGDDRDDIFWFLPGGADVQWWAPSRPAPGTTTLATETTSIQMDGEFSPVSDDFDGDGDDDILWYER